MVAGDLVNTAARIQGDGGARHGARRREHEAGDRGRDRLRGCGRARAEGEGGAGRALPRAACHRRPRGGAEVDRPRAAVRRPRPRAPARQGALPRQRGGEEGAPRLGRRDRRDRQVAARLGVREVHRRPDRRDLVAPRPLPGLRRRRRLLGARRDGADARADRRGGAEPTTRSRSCGTRSSCTCPTPRSARGSSRGSRICSASARRPRADRQELFSAWRLFFERLAEQGPCVLVFEDIQWAEPGLLDFIDHVLEWSRRLPIFVLALARPEIERGARRRVAQRDDARARAAQRRGDGCAARRIRAGAARRAARGDPRPRRGRSALRGRDGADAARPRPARARAATRTARRARSRSSRCPETLHALLAARLDGLTPEERALVHDASVLGKTFTKQGVAALSGQRRGRGRGAPPRPRPQGGAHPPGGRALAGARPVRLPPGPAQARRLRDALEGRPEGAPPGGRRGTSQRRGRTSTRSSRSSPPTTSRPTACCPEADDAAELKRQARDALARAGERAASLAATVEAAGVFAQAAELADDPLEEARLRDRAGRSAYSGGDMEAARRELERAQELYAAAGATREAALVQAMLGNTEWQLHESEPRARAAPGRLRRARRGRAGRGVRGRRGGAGPCSLLHGRPRGCAAHDRRRARGGRAALAAGDALPGAEHRRPDRRRRRAAGSRGMP